MRICTEPFSVVNWSSPERQGNGLQSSLCSLGLDWDWAPAPRAHLSQTVWGQGCGMASAPGNRAALPTWNLISFFPVNRKCLKTSLLTYEKHCVLLLAGQLLYSHQETGGAMWHLETDLPPKGLEWSWLAPLWAEHELNRDTIKISNGFFGVWCAQRPQ